MPNAISVVALIGWPLVVFMFCRSLPASQALLASLIGGYLLLPNGVAFDLPLLPTLDKHSIAALSFVLLFPLVGRRHIRPRPSAVALSEREEDWTQTATTNGRVRLAGREHDARGVGFRGLWIEWGLLALVVLTPALTVAQNAQPVIVGRRFLPGLTAYDALSMIQGAVVALLPYLLARRFLGHPDGQVLLLKALIVAGVLYSFLALIEIRLSPQLSRWMYGFLSQGFDQAVRDGGYRPVVFLQHGLWLAIFFTMTVHAAYAMWKQARLHRWLIAGLWLLVVLGLSRSLGALTIALVGLPVLLFLRPRVQVLLMSLIAMAVLLYPALRGANLIPLDIITELAQSISADRADSLAFRLHNEDELLARASEKSLSGWGSWGRNRIYDADGQDTSITDGLWIITIGTSGWLGYLGQFGLLTMPIVLLSLQRSRGEVTPALAGLCVILCGSIVDLIPNASLTPLTWIVAGALMGAARQFGTETSKVPVPPDTGRRVTERRKRVPLRGYLITDTRYRY